MSMEYRLRRALPSSRVTIRADGEKTLSRIAALTRSVSFAD